MATFDRILFHGQVYKFQATEAGSKLRVSYDSPAPRIAMDVTVGDRAYIEFFFYPVGDNEMVFQEVVGGQAKGTSLATFVEDTMTMLKMVAVHYGCPSIGLFDASSKGGYPLGLNKYRAPYVSYYAKHYGFFDDEMVLPSSATMEAILDDANAEVAANQAKAQRPYTKITNEMVVTMYYKIKRGEAVEAVAPKLKYGGRMNTYVRGGEWLAFRGEKYVAETIPYLTSIRNGMLIISGGGGLRIETLIERGSDMLMEKTEPKAKFQALKNVMDEIGQAYVEDPSASMDDKALVELCRLLISDALVGLCMSRADTALVYPFKELFSVVRDYIGAVCVNARKETMKVVIEMTCGAFLSGDESTMRTDCCFDVLNSLVMGEIGRTKDGGDVLESTVRELRDALSKMIPPYPRRRFQIMHLIHRIDDFLRG